MNERIDLLALQALDSKGGLDRHKFAELIIQETLKEVRDEVQYECDWKLADAVTERVKKHFGIE